MDGTLVLQLPGGLNTLMDACLQSIALKCYPASVRLTTPNLPKKTGEITDRCHRAQVLVAFIADLP